jgi:hypothetical protein
LHLSSEKKRDGRSSRDDLKMDPVKTTSDEHLVLEGGDLRSQDILGRLHDMARQVDLRVKHALADISDASFRSFEAVMCMQKEECCAARHLEEVVLPLLHRKPDARRNTLSFDPDILVRLWLSHSCCGSFSSFSQFVGHGREPRTYRELRSWWACGAFVPS